MKLNTKLYSFWNNALIKYALCFLYNALFVMLTCCKYKSTVANLRIVFVIVMDVTLHSNKLIFIALMTYFHEVHSFIHFIAFNSIAYRRQSIGYRICQ
jgi:hypothetical protein